MRFLILLLLISCGAKENVSYTETPKDSTISILQEIRDEIDELGYEDVDVYQIQQDIEILIENHVDVTVSVEKENECTFKHQNKKFVFFTYKCKKRVGHAHN